MRALHDDFYGTRQSSHDAMSQLKRRLHELEYGMLEYNYKNTLKYQVNQLSDAWNELIEKTLLYKFCKKAVEYLSKKLS